MINADPCFNTMMSAPSREFKGRVELLEGSTLLNTFTHDGALQSFTVDRAGESSKFFGFGVCQQLTVKLRDKERQINIVKGQRLEISMGVGCDYIYPCPVFFVDEITRDENTNELTVIAYDALNEATKHVLNEVTLPSSYDIKTFATALAAFLGMPMKIEGENLITYPYVNTGRELYGLTFTVNSDGSFYVNGTSTVAFANYIFQNITLPAGTYSFAALGDVSGGMLVLHDGTKYYTTSGTFTLTQTTELRVYFQVNVSGTTFNNALIKPMVVKGSIIPTSWQPYLAVFDMFYENGANFSGNETVREALNAVAEATQTIYYMNNNWELTFKRLDRDGEPVLNIPKSQYFTLTGKTSHTLSTITHVTELGDNVHATIGEGSIQFVRDNPFWNMRDDIGTLLDNAIAVAGGTTINQFDCKWRGNFLLELGDKISLVTKDDELIYAYVMDDTITYNGGVVEKTRWDFENKDTGTLSNPSTLGEALKTTTARVDKVNNRIELVASEVSDTQDAISSLQLTTNDISASVVQVEQSVNNGIYGINEELTSIRNEVSAKMTAEDVVVTIQEEMSNGINKVTTSTGFTFNDEGLTISKSDSEMTTTIDEDGMSVYRDNTEVLTADNQGVTAYNLHARTYLMIGTHSRLEDYGEDRTGCFWIGG